MNKQILNNILQFLERVQLQGKEVNAFNEVVNAILQELNKEEKVKEEVE